MGTPIPATDGLGCVSGIELGLLTFYEDLYMRAIPPDSLPTYVSLEPVLSNLCSVYQYHGEYSFLFLVMGVLFC